MKKITSFLISFFLCFFVFSACSKSNSSLDEGTKAIKEVLTSTSKAMESKYDMDCVGYKYAAKYEVEKLGLNFYIYQQLNVENGREILLDISNTLVEDVKNNQAIQSYLMESGFGYQNVSVTIFIYGKNNETSLEPNLGVVSLKKGVFEYKTYNKEAYETRGIPKTEIVFSETYSEALIALENQHSQEVI